MRTLAIVAVLALATSCASLRLAGLDPLPADAPFRGPEGSYTVTPPSDEWVRVEGNESRRNVDLSLARKSADAWLNVSVLRNRYPTADHALVRGRSRVEGLMSMSSREEGDAVVQSAGGPLPARLGRYCGTFDRELTARDTCFVILAAMDGPTTYVLVGQYRAKDRQLGRDEEMTRLVLSLRVEPPPGPDAERETAP